MKAISSLVAVFMVATTVLSFGQGTNNSGVVATMAVKKPASEPSCEVIAGYRSVNITERYCYGYGANRYWREEGTQLGYFTLGWGYHKMISPHFALAVDASGMFGGMRAGEDYNDDYDYYYDSNGRIHYYDQDHRGPKYPFGYVVSASLRLYPVDFVYLGVEGQYVGIYCEVGDDYPEEEVGWRNIASIGPMVGLQCGPSFALEISFQIQVQTTDQDQGGDNEGYTDIAVRGIWRW